MKSQLENELALARGLINEFITDDPFPSQIRPEALRKAVRLYPMRGGKRLRPVCLRASGRAARPCAGSGCFPAVRKNTERILPF